MSPTHQDLSNDTTFSQIKSRVPVPLKSICFVLQATVKPTSRASSRCVPELRGTRPCSPCLGTVGKNNLTHFEEKTIIYSWRKTILYLYGTFRKKSQMKGLITSRKQSYSVPNTLKKESYRYTTVYLTMRKNNRYRVPYYLCI